MGFQPLCTLQLQSALAPCQLVWHEPKFCELKHAETPPPVHSSTRSPMSEEAVSLSQLRFHWPPTSSSRWSQRFAARKRSPANARIPHSGQRCRRRPEWGMRQLVGGFDPSLEPLRPMGQAHRGVPKVRWPPSSRGSKKVVGYKEASRPCFDGRDVRATMA